MVVTVIIVSNPTAVEVVLSCIEVVVGVLTIIITLFIFKMVRQIYTITNSNL